MESASAKKTKKNNIRYGRQLLSIGKNWNHAEQCKITYQHFWQHFAECLRWKRCNISKNSATRAFACRIRPRCSRERAFESFSKLGVPKWQCQGTRKHSWQHGWHDHGRESFWPPRMIHRWWAEWPRSWSFWLPSGQVSSSSLTFALKQRNNNQWLTSVRSRKKKKGSLQSWRRIHQFFGSVFSSLIFYEFVVGT